MGKNSLLKKAKKEGFESVDDFVKANLHYLPKDKKRLFYIINDPDKDYYQKEILKETYHKGDFYNGKD